MLNNLKTIKRYFHTIRYLRFTQIYFRLFRGSQAVHNEDFINIKCQLPKKTYQEPIQKLSSMHEDNRFSFLNEDHYIKTNDDWNSNKISKLWLYNLHYFNDLCSENHSLKNSLHHSHIDRWILENPYPSGNGWEPYPTSLRVVNWVKYFLSGNKIKTDWLSSLAIQAEHLSKNIEYRILGNHLIANAKALIYAGVFLDTKHAESWLKQGQNILSKEICEQILSDGGHFELSPMYQGIILEDLLDVYNLFNAYEIDKPSKLKPTILKMFFWLKNMIHPDFNISFFNDSALGISPSIDEIESYISRNRIAVKQINNKKLITLSESGYSRVTGKEYIAILDHGQTGPTYLGGHSHADTLSFELSLFDHRVIVNSGTSIYGGLIDSKRADPLRAYQRGTASHSTIMIDKKNSSDVWGAFRLGKRANIKDLDICEQEGKVKIMASHDGYKNILSGVIHKRTWEFNKSSLIINDEINGGKIDKMIEMILPLHPNVKVNSVNKKTALCEIHGNEFYIEYLGNGLLQIKDSEYYPEFGKASSNIKLVFKVKTQLPYNLKTRIEW